MTTPTKTRKATAASRDIEWLRSCGWAGWLEDQITGEVVTSHGEVFTSASGLRTRLEKLPGWPRLRDGARNVPAALLAAARHSTKGKGR